MSQSTVLPSTRPELLDFLLANRLVEAVSTNGETVRLVLVDEVVLTGPEAARVREIQDSWLAQDNRLPCP